MNNYEYCADFIASRLAPGAKVLDYGCGGGAIVNLCRGREIDAYGCDVFYEGGDYSTSVPPELLGTVIRRMEGDRIPFEANSFDCVVNNQVLEHVPDLDVVVSEISRVLKPSGFVLSMFPDRSVWREGHCGIPFLHRFRKRSRMRVWYAALLRGIGFGYHKKDKSVLRWSQDFCDWLDAWTHYRPYGAIRAAFHRQFLEIEHHEDDWLSKRLSARAAFVAPLPVWARRWFVRKMMGLVFVAHTRADRGSSISTAA
jgi:SAM-dependent methyltransferase